MAKVVRQIISNKYFTVQADTLVEGSIVPFDCYIKRFGDYVIIIEAGTLITKSLYEKISLNQTIYLLRDDAEKVKEYYLLNNARAEENGFEIPKYDAVASVLGLRERLTPVGSFEERLSMVYMSVAGLIESIFKTSDENLPLGALRVCASNIAEYINTDRTVMPIFLKIIPKEYSTCYHSTNVAFFSAILGKAIDLTKEEIVDLALAGLLHDIGKIRIDSKILLKPGVLDPDEYEIMKNHCDYGFIILKNNGIENQKILNGVRYHHEKLDRTGYPQRLYGKLIPKFARIIGLCDVFDALTTKRTFRENYTSFEALLLIKREMNAQFDEQFTDAFIRLLR